METNRKETEEIRNVFGKKRTERISLQARLRIESLAVAGNDRRQISELTHVSKRTVKKIASEIKREFAQTSRIKLLAALRMELIRIIHNHKTTNEELLFQFITTQVDRDILTARAVAQELDLAMGSEAQTTAKARALVGRIGALNAKLLQLATKIPEANKKFITTISGIGIPVDPTRDGKEYHSSSSRISENQKALSDSRDKEGVKFGNIADGNVKGGSGLGGEFDDLIALSKIKSGKGSDGKELDPEISGVIDKEILSLNRKQSYLRNLKRGKKPGNKEFEIKNESEEKEEKT